MELPKKFVAFLVILLILWAMEIYPYVILFFKFLQFHFGSELGFVIFDIVSTTILLAFMVIIDRYVERLIESPYSIKFLGYFITLLIVLIIVSGIITFPYLILFFQLISEYEDYLLLFLDSIGCVTLITAIIFRYEKRVKESKKFRSLAIFYITTFTLGIALFYGILFLILFLV